MNLWDIFGMVSGVTAIIMVGLLLRHQLKVLKHIKENPQLYRKNLIFVARRDGDFPILVGPCTQSEVNEIMEIFGLVHAPPSKDRKEGPAQANGYRFHSQGLVSPSVAIPELRKARDTALTEEQEKELQEAIEKRKKEAETSELSPKRA